MTMFFKNYLQNPKEKIMKTKSALKIMFRIRQVFPKDRINAEGLLKELKMITETEAEHIQKDILTLATRYQANLNEVIQSIKAQQLL